jgi:hypothetical protein
LTATAAEDVVTIAVTDTGMGIAAEDQAATFEEFRQVGRDDAAGRGQREQPDFLVHTWTSGKLPGTYVFFLAAPNAATGNLLGLSTATAVLGP